MMSTGKQLCGRCGKVADPNGRWEHGWPLHGRIELGFPAQAFAFLAGSQTAAYPQHFEAWNIGHPAAIVNDAQKVVFEWSHTAGWRLCYECQKELLQIVGRFFNYGDRKGIRQREIAELRHRLAELEATH